MTKLMKTVAAAAIALSASCYTASAEFAINEARFGASSAQPEWIPGNNEEEDQFLLTGEVLFNPVNIDFMNMFGGEPSSFEYAVFNPRPHIGGAINFDDDGTSTAYAGLTWHFPMGDIFFAEATFGFGINDGQKEKIAGSGRADLGSHLLFRESIGLGVNITENTTFVLQLAHQSHANLAGDENHGLTNAGGKLGFKF